MVELKLTTWTIYNPEVASNQVFDGPWIRIISIPVLGHVPREVWARLLDLMLSGME